MAVFALLLMQACANPQKMIYKGQYDAVVIKISDKFKKSTKRKPENCGYLQDAFTRANNGDVAAIDQLKAENNEANWAKINDIYKKIVARQQRVSPLLPLKDGNGKSYDFAIIDVTLARIESQQKAAEFHYGRGTAFLEQANKQESNYQRAARDAYAEFDAVQKLNSNYKENAKLLAQARELGTINILATFSDNSNSGQSYNKNSMMDSIFYNYRGDTWTKLDYAARPNVKYHFDLIFMASKLQTSDISSKDITNARTVNVDTTIANVRQTQTVNATVITRAQRQSILMEGTWQVIDKTSGALLCNQNIIRSYVHEHKSATFTGDRRALTAEDLAATKNTATFPPRATVFLYLATQTRLEIARVCQWQKP